MAVPDMILVPANELERFATDIFVAAGLSVSMSSAWAEALVWANRRGTDSHGVLRIPQYIDMIRRGEINVTPVMRVTNAKGGVCVLEADRAPGPIAMFEAMRLAVATARDHGVGWCGARNITHAGAVGQFATKAAELGLAGIVIAASTPLMAYHGSRVPGVSTNPLSIAFPRSHGFPLLLDMASSTVAHGKLLVAKEAGQSIPSGWAVDKEGRPTTKAEDAATLTPLGGPKGAGLSLMIECLTSVAMLNPIVAPSLSSTCGNDISILNGAAIALDLSVFGEINAIRGEVDRLAEAILGLPRAEGVECVYLPGGRGDTVRRERDATGIPIPAATWRRLNEVANELGISGRRSVAPVRS